MNATFFNRDSAFFHKLAHYESDAVTHGICLGCGLCAMVCPTHALTVASPYGDEAGSFQKTPVLQSMLCVHCGRCVSVCPSDTLHQLRRTNVLRTVLETKPHTVVFLCRNLAALAPTPLNSGSVPPSMDMAEARMSPPLDQYVPGPGVIMEVVRCTGRLGARFLDRLTLLGVRNILIFACPPRQCAYHTNKCLIESQALGLAAVYESYGIPTHIKVQYDLLTSVEDLSARVDAFLAEDAQENG